MCIGEGPVVHVTPLSLDWGQIPVLTDVVRVIKLSNESLVPSKFTAHMVGYAIYGHDVILLFSFLKS